MTLSGTAATGAAFTGGVVSVTDSTGVVVGTSGPVGDDGKFSITLNIGAKLPFVLMAERATLNGQFERLFSVVSATPGDTATVNLTPVTTLIVALLSPSGDPANLAVEVSAGTAQVTNATVATVVNQVQTLLNTLLGEVKRETDASRADLLHELLRRFDEDGTVHAVSPPVMSAPAPVKRATPRMGVEYATGQQESSNGRRPQESDAEDDTPDELKGMGAGNKKKFQRRN